MALLLDVDYEILSSAGIETKEDEKNRFLVLKDFALEEGLYQYNGEDLRHVDILVVIPANYNSIGHIQSSKERTGGKSRLLLDSEEVTLANLIIKSSADGLDTTDQTLGGRKQTMFRKFLIG